jgi:DNA repair photolyase
MIKEVNCQQAIDYEYQPDGGKTPVVDAYDGCQLKCPYCFQWQDPGWNRHILVKTNLPEILTQELAGWDPAQTLYVGSRGDPYMPLEGKYRLTRKILRVLLEHGIACILSTKSSTTALSDDIDLFRKFGDKLVVCVGQANLDHFQKTTDPHQLPNVRLANVMARQGIQTWVFITPALPGITDVKAMIEALPVEIPVFLDKIRMEAGGRNTRRFLKHLDRYYPSLKARYRKIIETGSDPYYQELKEMYCNDQRIKFIFGEA